MLLIREAQLQIFQDALSFEFEARLYHHLRGGFARQIESLGEANAKDLIHFGVQKAQAYGIYTERDVFCFCA